MFLRDRFVFNVILNIENMGECLIVFDSDATVMTLQEVHPTVRRQILLHHL